MRLYCDHCYREFANLNYEEDYPIQIDIIKRIYREHRTSDECRGTMSVTSLRDAGKDEDDQYW